LQDLTPDLILMDVQLPGLDGLSFTRELKADPRTARVPVVAVSAHALAQNVEKARAVGCAEYITKPITDDPFVFLDRLSGYVTRAPVVQGPGSGKGGGPPPLGPNH